jgi:hypothetical protein
MKNKVVVFLLIWIIFIPQMGFAYDRIEFDKERNALLVELSTLKNAASIQDSIANYSGIKELHIYCNPNKNPLDFSKFENLRHLEVIGTPPNRGAIKVENIESISWYCREPKRNSKTLTFTEILYQARGLKNVRKIGNYAQTELEALLYLDYLEELYIRIPQENISKYLKVLKSNSNLSKLDLSLYANNAQSILNELTSLKLINLNLNISDPRTLRERNRGIAGDTLFIAVNNISDSLVMSSGSLILSRDKCEDGGGPKYIAFNSIRSFDLKFLDNKSLLEVRFFYDQRDDIAIHGNFLPSQSHAQIIIKCSIIYRKCPRQFAELLDDGGFYYSFE